VPSKDLKGKSTPTFARANPSPVPTLELVLASPPPPPASVLHFPETESKVITSLSEGLSLNRAFPKRSKSPIKEPPAKKSEPMVNRL